MGFLRYVGVMSFSIWDHLDELRSRLLKMGAVILVMTLATFWAADWMLVWLLKPAPLHPQTLTSLQPAGVFLQSMRLALISGVVLSLPIVLSQVWGFISPGLVAAERKVMRITLYIGTLLFAAGVLFAYYGVVPKALQFFWSYSLHLGVQPSWTIDAYLNFVLMFLLSFGLAFELPLVLLLLIRFGVLKREWIMEKRPFVIVAIAIIAGVLTPPDVISQLMMGVPLWILFELSLFVSRWFLPNP